MRLITLLLFAISVQAADAQRIISTAPSITETLFAMGLGPRVVGDTIYCNFPEAAAKLPKIGTLLKPDPEAIVALRPDLVVVQKQPNNLPEQLDRLHIRYIVMDTSNLDMIYAGARAVGKATGESALAERLVHKMQTELQSLAALTSRRPKPTVAFIVGHTAGRLEGMVAGSSTSYFSDLLNAAGGVNVFSDVSAPYPKISLEQILSRDPDVIIELSGDTRPKQEEVLALWQTLPRLKAVSTKRVFAIPSEPFVIPGPRAPEAARSVARLLHPEIKLPEPPK
jgi:iron complex transport system substrate-binding protein